MICRLWITCPLWADHKRECMHSRPHHRNIHCSRTENKDRYYDSCNYHDCLEMEGNDEDGMS